MAWQETIGGQPLPLSTTGGGPKGPPSAPPTIPPIIINPFKYYSPEPAIDPRITPLGPPVIPPRQPAMSLM